MKLNNTPFPPELRTVAIVPRWSIVYTTQKDTVSSHSYFVTIYSHMIARTIKWKGPFIYLLFSALTHDIDEVFTGDIVSPVKKFIVDEERSEDFVNKMIGDRMGGINQEMGYLLEKIDDKYVDEADAIIKTADRLDAHLFLIMEKRRGNAVIEPLIMTSRSLLEAAWRDLPTSKEVIDQTWQTVMLPSIDLHTREGGRGI